MDQVAAPFAQSLATINRVGECYISFLIGSLISEAREKLAKQALELKADYILWLDSDMMFPADVMERMLRHMEEGRDIVSGLYFRRRAPFTPVLFKSFEIDEENHKGTWEGYDNYPRHSMFEIAACGFGCVMMRADIIEDVFINYKTAFGQLQGYGEDMSFSWRARQLGYKIWCDSTIGCGHVGQVIVDEHIYLTNFADNKKKE